MLTRITIYLCNSFLEEKGSLYGVSILMNFGTEIGETLKMVIVYGDWRAVSKN